MHIKPAIRLEELDKEICKLTFELNEASENGEDVASLKEKLHELNLEFDKEFDNVIDEYYNLFQEHYFCTEDLQEMFDLDIQMVAKRMTPELDSIYFSKIIRRYIKSCRIKKTYDRLETLLFKKGVNIDRKIFFSRASVQQWLEQHIITKNDKHAPIEIINNLMLEKGVPALMSTTTYKNKMGLKYDMQLKRLKRERLYFKMIDGNKRMLSRIPVNLYLDVLIREIDELE